MTAARDASGSGDGPIRVLVVLPFGQVGGAETMVQRLLRSMPDAVAAEAVLLDDGPFAERLEADGVPVETVPLPGKAGVLRFPGAARSIARRHPDVDLVHANGTKGALLGILVARRLRTPLVWLKPDHFFDGRVARAIARRCDRVICVSRTMAAQFGPELADRVSVAYPGVMVPERADPVGPDPTIACLGRLDRLKGFDELIRALAVLRDRGVEARLRIAGPPDRMMPEYADELHALIAELGLEDRAEIMGWVEDLDAFIAGARVVAMASKPPTPGRPSEAAPTVLMDAMARGRPVVAQREGGTEEIVGDAGTLVGPVTPERLADAIEPYLLDRELAATTGERARERAARLFDMRSSAEHVSGVYRQLAPRRPPSGSPPAASTPRRPGR
jgi:glycosyltransferase involved in cell wall biosynthesis